MSFSPASARRAILSNDINFLTRSSIHFFLASTIATVENQNANNIKIIPISGCIACYINDALINSSSDCVGFVYINDFDCGSNCLENFPVAA